MELNETVTNGIVVLALSGKLDAVTTPDLTAWFEGQTGAHAKRMVIDCAGLTYLSSAGLRGFLTAGKQLKSRGGGLVFSGLTGVVREVFQVSGFAGIFAVFPDQDAAMAALRSDSP